MNTTSLDDGNNTDITRVVILPDKASDILRPLAQAVFCVQDTFVCVIVLLFMR